jgi:hypothetical protein
MSKPGEPWRNVANRTIDGVVMNVYSVTLTHCKTREVCTITGILAGNTTDARHHARERMRHYALWDVANCIRLQ